MMIRKFEELKIWRLSLKITKEIYDLTATNKFIRDFGLKEQIQRAVVSISSNIVEGFEKSSNNEFVRFLKIAKGSVGEVRNQLYVALEVSYISQTEFNQVNAQLLTLASQIAALIIYLKKPATSNLITNHAK